MLFSEVAHRADQEIAVGPGGGANVRERLGDQVAGFPVDLEVVLAAQPIVVAAGRMRDRGVQFLDQLWCLGHGWALSGLEGTALLRRSGAGGCGGPVVRGS